ncbi:MULTISPECIES: MFS transporter [Sphingobium]|uniref:MFS transporter n=1 Tax=Sphingobium TaxID=165695 RepID=UPI0017F05642|nr:MULTISPECIES: MFS transporter [Sphingobium]MCW2363905.1 MFS family permease [Sphingobium sp. B10D3B]MCW2402698.1 MFS family permease [Sphingobium sp. B10D7B]MCW2409677.1 MFS family permease [Sphingobium xanthum]
MSRRSEESEYQFEPHERPMMPGSPATPYHPGRRRLGYLLIGVLLGLTGGFINGLLMANLPQIQGALGLTSVEAGWLTAAYTMTNVCMSLLLIKFRQQFGIQRFVRIVLIGFLVLNTLQLFVHSYGLELFVRAGSGIVASGLSTMALFYIMQSMKAEARLGGLVLGVGVSQIATPLARVISPALLIHGDVQNLYLFEFGLTLLCLAGVWLLRLPPSERIDAFEPLDFLTFALFAPGIALLSAVLVQGRIVWWSTQWLGYALAGAILLIGAAVIVEHNRANPLLNTRWMGSAAIIRFAVIAASMRVLLGEQNVGASGLLTVLGMGQDQLIAFYTVVTLATIFGLAVSLKTLKPTDLLKPVIISCALIALAAFFDTQSSNLTRPAQLYVTQAMISFAAIYFMGPTLMAGILQALAKGPSHIVSFSAVFGISQQLGGIGGAALLGSFQIIRERFHSEMLVQSLVGTDPQVAQRIQQLGGAYARTLGDPALRQAEGSILLSQQVAREANILAFNDVFMLVGALATLAFVYLGARWIYYRRKGITPLAEELAALAAMRTRAQS